MTSATSSGSAARCMGMRWRNATMASDHDHGGAIARETVRRGGTDAGSGAGDEHNLAREAVLAHVFSSWVV